MKSVFIIDDHIVFREGLRLMMEEIPGVVVCGDCGSGDAYLFRIFSLKPDLILMDMHLQAHSSLSLTKAFSHMQPQPRIVLMTMSEEERYIRDGLERGASAVMLKTSAGQEIQQLFNEFFPGETGRLVSSAPSQNR